MAARCLRDAVLQVSVESLQVDPGLMAAAVVLGVLLGVATAALLWFFVFLPRLKKQDDSGRLLKLFDERVTRGNQSKKRCESNKKRRDSEVLKKDLLLEDDDPSAARDLAAFASRAKVIYPINQKFRPLADGASNPSLHENTKQSMLPNQMECSSTSSLESLSQGDKDDCSSSTTIHSATSDDRFYERTFVRVTCFPDVLACDSFDVKMCLYSLHLKGLFQLDTDLRQEKHLMFIQVLRWYLTDLKLRKKIDGNFLQNILSTQESDLKDLETQFHSRMTIMQTPSVRDSAYQTLEDIARQEKEFADNVIQNMEFLWKQLDKLHRFLMEQSKCTSDEARKITQGVTEKTITVEAILMDSQDVHSMDFQEKMIRWAYMAKVIDSLKSQMQHESECRLNAVSVALEQLVTKRILSARQKEHQLTDLLRAFWEEVTRYNNECLQQTKDVIAKLLKERSDLMEKLRHDQKVEQETFLKNIQPTVDLMDFLKDYHTLLEKQREALCDLEEEEDCKTTEAVADVCKDLYSGASQAFERLVKELLLKTLPSVTTLSSRECEILRQEVRQNLMLELEKADNHRKRCLKLFQELLLQEKQMWVKEHALSAVLQAHLSEKHEKILQDAISHLSGLNEENTAFVLQRNRLLLDSVLRVVALRNVSMATQTQMKVCRKKSLLQELREQHLVDKGVETHSPDEMKWQLHKEMESRILEKEQRVEEELQQAQAEFHQQLIMEIQEGFQLLQQHMEQVIGQVLVKHAQQEAAESMSEDDDQDLKVRLIETSVESVFVTSNGVNRLVNTFYEQLQQILQHYEQGNVKQMKAFQSTAEESRRRKKKEMHDLFMKEKVLNGQLTATSGLQQRMLLKTNMLLDLSDGRQHHLDYLKQKKLLILQISSQLKNQLKEAEQKFLSDLAAMAKVRVTELNQLVSQSNPSEQNLKTKSKNVEPWENEGDDDFNANDLRSHRQVVHLFRTEELDLQEIDQAQKSRKATKKRDN